MGSTTGWSSGKALSALDSGERSVGMIRSMEVHPKAETEKKLAETEVGPLIRHKEVLRIDQWVKEALVVWAAGDAAAPIGKSFGAKLGP
jgi:hypothetical protein